MNKLSLLTLILLALLCVACDDDNDDGILVNPIEETHRYLPLQVGNYWVYDVYEIRDGVETKVNRQDTIKVLLETNIRGDKYFNLQIRDYQQRWREWHTLRDSLGYLVSYKGEKIFSNILFDTIIREYHTLAPSKVDTLASEYYRIRNVKEPVITSVGTFNVLDLEDDVLVPQNKYNKKTHCYFAKDIGIIFKTYTYISSPPTYWIEQRLVKYCINGKKYPEK